MIEVIIYIVIAVLIANLGSKRKIGYWWSLVAVLLLTPILGLVIVLFSEKTTTTETTKYKTKFRQYVAEAEKAIYKEDNKLALDKYYDAAYELENSYPNLKKKDEKVRVEKLEEIKTIISNLKTKVSEDIEVS